MKTVLALFLLLFIFNAAWAGDAPIKSEAPFKVEIAINAASLEAEPYRSQHVFFTVDTKVTNVSHREQEIVAWYQYAWSWLSSSPEVSPAVSESLLKNYSTRIVLQPGQSYARQVGMGSNSLRRPVTFRLGFVPKAAHYPVSDQPNPPPNGEIFWSNYVTLTR